MLVDNIKYKYLFIHHIIYNTFAILHIYINLHLHFICRYTIKFLTIIHSVKLRPTVVAAAAVWNVEGNRRKFNPNKKKNF